MDEPLAPELAPPLPAEDGPSAPLFESLLARIRSHEARVAVIGLGYVGLPLVRLFGSKGFTVFGFDVDGEKVARLERGESYVAAVSSQAVAAMREAGRLHVSTDLRLVEGVDAAVICVPTPLTADGRPDLSFIRATAKAVGQRLRAGQLVVLESTTYPGTTREVVKTELERRGLRCGRDFFLAFSPEREDPGNRDFTNERIPKVVGGMDPASRRLAAALYGEAVTRVVEVSSCEVAEAAKLLENIYRCVNIALVNELKMCLDRMGIDVWEVIAAASTKPFGFQPFQPGPGLGGHCIPIDPFYLSWKAKEFQFSTRFIDLAGEINVQMPYYVVGKLESALQRQGRSLEGAKVLLLGLAYKKDVDDPRESPAFKLLEILESKRAKVSCHDPLIRQAPLMRHYKHLKPRLVELTEPCLAAQDAAVIVTDHSSYDPGWIVRHSKLVVDTRNATAGVRGFAERIVRA